jgi:hypothetical protein
VLNDQGTHTHTYTAMESKEEVVHELQDVVRSTKRLENSEIASVLQQHGLDQLDRFLQTHITADGQVETVPFMGISRTLYALLAAVAQKMDVSTESIATFTTLIRGSLVRQCMTLPSCQWCQCCILLLTLCALLAPIQTEQSSYRHT